MKPCCQAHCGDPISLQDSAGEMLTPAVRPLPSVSLVLFLPHQTSQGKDLDALLGNDTSFLLYKNSSKKTALGFFMRLEDWKGEGVSLRPLPHQGATLIATRAGITAPQGGGSLSRGKTAPFCALKSSLRLNPLDMEDTTTHLQSLGRRWGQQPGLLQGRKMVRLLL